MAVMSKSSIAVCMETIHNYLKFLWNKNKKSGFNMDKIFLFIKINKISHANLYSQTSWQTNSHEMKREIAVCH